MTKPTTLDMTAPVELELTSFGRKVMSRYLRMETARALGQELDDGAEVSTEEQRRRAMTSPDRVQLPLWEMLKIFGAHTVSSTRLPFLSIAFAREESSDEVQLRETKARGANIERALRDLLACAWPEIRYKAPEELPGIVAGYIDAEVPRIPDRAGPWWHGNRVVQVRSYGGELWLVHRNNHRTPVSQATGWQGPAIKDRRVLAAGDDGDDAIPF